MWIECMVMAIPHSHSAIQLWVREEFKYIYIDFGQNQQWGREGGNYDVV